MLHPADSRPHPSCGVPAEVFTPGFNGTVESPSGLSLSCQSTDRLIRIEDLTHRSPAGEAYFVFDARVNRDQAEDSPQLTVMVRTHHDRARPTRHPDLHAAALLTRSMVYFDDIDPIVSLKARWNGELQSVKTNYNQYRKALDQYPEPIEEAKQAAAFSTWTGRQALLHGFTLPPQVTSQSYTQLTVLFKRPGKS
jgi:hypothetical protein